MLLKRVLTRALNQDPLWQSHSHFANASQNANFDDLSNALSRASVAPDASLAPDDLDFEGLSKEEGLRQPSSMLPDL
jgi:hypothetical protein